MTSTLPCLCKYLDFISTTKLQTICGGITHIESREPDPTKPDCGFAFYIGCNTLHKLEVDVVAGLEKVCFNVKVHSVPGPVLESGEDNIDIIIIIIMTICSLVYISNCEVRHSNQ